MRFGLIGYGLWGRHHAAVLRRTAGIELVAIAAAGEVTAAQARADHPTVEVLLGHRALLARAEVEAVSSAVRVPLFLGGTSGELARCDCCRRIRAICSTVGPLRMVASAMFSPNSSCNRAISRTASSECPPRSKKLSVTPTGRRPSTCSQIPTSFNSSGSRGAMTCEFR